VRERGGQSRHKTSGPSSRPSYGRFYSPYSRYIVARMAEENPGALAANVPYLGVDELGASVIVEPGLEGSNAGGRTLPAAAIKFADLTESGSESGDNEAEEPVSAGPDNANAIGEPGTSASAAEENGTVERNSPPPNCAICLSRCRRKCFTDSCMHQFCFKCLCEWSKVTSPQASKPLF